MDTTIPKHELSNQINELTELYVAMRIRVDRFRTDDYITIEVSKQSLNLLRANIVYLQNVLYGVIPGVEDDTLVRCAQD